jgi:hypothetical protein
MTIEKLKQIAYAQGWIEGRLQEDLNAVNSAAEPDEEEIKHRKGMLEAFSLVSDALDNLRRENERLEFAVTQAKQAFGLAGR